ncbi:hypothetical protein [Streptomyces kanamyceticus]|uniref:hypothetical protein n=1 Tax=Streptomyces kanamyceticus TaxID=1967 RepID=UPI0037DC8A34
MIADKGSPTVPLPVSNYIDMRFQTGTAKGCWNLHKYYLSTTSGQIVSYRNNISVSAKLRQKSVTWQETGASGPAATPPTRPATQPSAGPTSSAPAVRSRLRTGPTCKGPIKRVGREAPQQFTPASASWLNLDERWFAELTQNEFKRGVHRCVQALERGVRSKLAD